MSFPDEWNHAQAAAALEQKLNKMQERMEKQRQKEHFKVIVDNVAAFSLEQQVELYNALVTAMAA